MKRKRSVSYISEGCFFHRHPNQNENLTRAAMWNVGRPAAATLRQQLLQRRASQPCSPMAGSPGIDYFSQCLMWWRWWRWRMSIEMIRMMMRMGWVMYFEGVIWVHARLCPQQVAPAHVLRKTYFQTTIPIFFTVESSWHELWKKHPGHNCTLLTNESITAMSSAVNLHSIFDWHISKCW